MYNGSNKCAKKGVLPIQTPSTLSAIFALNLMMYTKEIVLNWELKEWIQQPKQGKWDSGDCIKSLDNSLIITFTIMFLSPVLTTDWATSLITHPAAIIASILIGRALFKGNKTHLEWSLAIVPILVRFYHISDTPERYI